MIKNKKKLTLYGFAKILFISALIYIVLFYATVFILLGTKYYRSRNAFERETLGWQTVIVNNIASFKVPPEWVVTIKNNEIYITDKSMDDAEYMVLAAGTAWEDFSEREYAFEMFGDDVEYIGYVQGNGQSSSIGGQYSKVELRIGNEIAIKQNAYLSDGFMGINIYAWCDSIEEEIMILIARSFRNIS